MAQSQQQYILPIELYRQHEAALVSEGSFGHLWDIKSCLTFKLLRDDPEARLIFHCHGAAGTVD